MEAGAEIDHHVELAVSERESADVCHDELRGSLALPQALAGLAQKASVDIDTNQTRWPQMVGQGRQGDSSAAAHFEHSFPPGQVEGPKHQGDLNMFLTPVAASFVCEWAILGGAVGAGHRASPGDQ